MGVRESGISPYLRPSILDMVNVATRIDCNFDFVALIFLPIIPSLLFFTFVFLIHPLPRGVIHVGLWCCAGLSEHRLL